LVVVQHAYSFNDNTIFQTVDSGASWSELTRRLESKIRWYPAINFGASIFAFAFDPIRRGQAWMSDWYRPYMTVNLSDKPVIWSERPDGFEEMVVLSGSMYSPKRGPNFLIVGVADNMGFAISDVGLFPRAKLSGVPGYISNITSIAGSEQQDPIIAVTGSGSRQGSDFIGGAYSVDNGEHFQPFAQLPYPGTAGGKIAVGADGGAFLWATPQGIYRSADRGKTWQHIEPPPNWNNNDVANRFTRNRRLVADQIEPGTFYVATESKFYSTRDTGNSWMTGMSFNPAAGRQYLASSAFHGGVLYLAQAYQGLFISRNKGETFEKVAGFDSALLIAEGCLSSSQQPILYVVGSTSGKSSGLFQSDDGAKTWTKLLDDFRLSNEPREMIADRQHCGRAFVGTNGSGVLTISVPY
jgi:photosystem II stability/assembly factor-like uncharacterized protein